MSDEELFAQEDIRTLIEEAATPAEAMAILDEFVARQKSWSDRCFIEKAARDLLVIEHFKTRSRA